VEQFGLVERGMIGNQRVGGPQIMLVSLPVRGRCRQNALCFGLVHLDGQHRDDGTGDLVLDRKDVLKLAIITLGPAMGPGDGIDELRADTNAVAELANAALQHVTHPKLASHLPDVDGPALVLKARIAGDDQQFGKA